MNYIISFFFSFIVVFHGPVSNKKKFGIGNKQKNWSSFQSYKDSIAETEVVDQPLDETTYTETT